MSMAIQKSNRIAELKASLDKSPYVGLTKEECLYYIEVRLIRL
jgi:hypothetical protein